MNRDAKGRFTSDADHASTLLLEAAVAEAVAVLRNVRDPEGYYYVGEDNRSRFMAVIVAADLLMRRAG